MGPYRRLIGRSWGDPFRIHGILKVKGLVEAFGERTFQRTAAFRSLLPAGRRSGRAMHR
jgi:hypothetical protein